MRGIRILVGSLTEQRKKERYVKTKEKRSPSVLGTPDEYWCPLYSDSDRHADGKYAEQSYQGGDSAGKSVQQDSYGDDSAGIISQLEYTAAVYRVEQSKHGLLLEHRQ